MDTITIDGKAYKVQPEVAELLLMVSEERDELQEKLFRSEFKYKPGEDWLSFSGGFS